MNRKSTLVLITCCLSISLASFAQSEHPTPSKTILGMVLLDDINSLQFDKVVIELKEKWNLPIESAGSGNEATLINIDNYRIAILSLPTPIPGNEIETTARYNYLWINGQEEATRHKGHIIVSLLDAGQNPVKENILFNQVTAAILNNSQSLGIYMGSRTLLLKKDFYLTNTATMSDEELPIYNWVYLGLRQEKGKQSIYTYGLTHFGKHEMEIVNSNHSFEELSELMYMMAHYVIASDVILKDGETIGMSEDQKLEISLSKGKYTEGKTLKIKY